MNELTILGAGISGLTCAISLAKAGHKVTVFEKNSDVGMRFNGDMQGLENWSERIDITKQLKEMDISINFDCDPFSEYTISDGIKEKTFSTKKPLFYLVKRGAFDGSLDYGLKKQALEAGVEILFNKTMPAEEADIVATGPEVKKIRGIDKGIVYNTDSKDKIVLVLNDDLAFKGYSYLLITKNYGCMCTVVIDEIHRAQKCFENTERYFDEKHPDVKTSVKKVGGTGTFGTRHPLRIINGKKETLFVGEAAGLQDMWAGFGMRYAFESGYLAANCIHKNKDYGKEARRKFENKLKAGMVNRYLFESFGKKIYSFIVMHPDLIGKSLGTIYNYSLIHRILYPLAHSYIKDRYPTLSI
jgi:flavin-dependent dehydrogenase